MSELADYKHNVAALSTYTNPAIVVSM